MMYGSWKTAPTEINSSHETAATTKDDDATLLQSSDEFVAVVLACSVGQRLEPLTSSNTLPKHLLHVCGIANIIRVVTALQDSGFLRIIVVVVAESPINPTVQVLHDAFCDNKILPETTTHVVDDENIHNMNQTILLTNSSAAAPQPSTTITVVELHNRRPQQPPDNAMDLDNNNNDVVNDEITPISALRCIEYHKTIIPSIQSHLCIVPGDVIVLDTKSIQHTIHQHRLSSSAACTVLLSDVREIDEQTLLPLKESAKQKKGFLSRQPEEIDYIALSSSTTSARRLIWKQSKLDVEHDNDMVGSTPKITIPKSRICNGTVAISTEWNDIHVYCIAPWVRQLIVHRTSLKSIQQDVVPLLISRQFQGIYETFGKKFLESNRTIVDDILAVSTNKKSNHPLDTVATDITTTNSSIKYVVNAYVESNNKSVFRMNTTASYLYANREMSYRMAVQSHLQNIGSSSSSSASTTVHRCLRMPLHTVMKSKFHTILLMSDNTNEGTIGDKVTFKSCVIGKDCRIGTKCKLHTVVIHDDGVTIGDNVILQNTIVGANVTIGANTTLTDCCIRANTVVPAGTKKKNCDIVE